MGDRSLVLGLSSFVARLRSLISGLIRQQPKDQGQKTVDPPRCILPSSPLTYDPNTATVTRRSTVLDWLGVLLATIGATLILFALTFVSALVGVLVHVMIVLMSGPIIDGLLARRRRRAPG